MKESAFKFSNPQLLAVEFIINENFDPSNFEGFSMVNNVETNKNPSEPEATVSLELIIGEKNDTSPFYIKIKNSAHFKSNNQQLFDKLIDTNAPALLLSYIRPIVSLLTSQSRFKSFDIPFINFKKSEWNSKSIINK